MDTNRYSKEKKSGGSILGLIICAVLAVFVFIALILINNGISRAEDNTTVIVAAADIPEYTVITKENAEKYFKADRRTESSAFEGSYSSLKDVFKGTDSICTTYGMKKGEILGANMYAPYLSAGEGFTEPVEMGIKASSFQKAAGGILRRGDTVDMGIVDDMDEEQSIRLYILKAFDSEGTEISADDNTGVAVAFNVLLEREDYAAVAQIAADEDFDLMKVNDIQ